MKGVILAGGNGTRMLPCTKVTNKHLLPVLNKPMIYYPIETLKLFGITDILIVTGQEHCGDFMKLLGNGEEFGCKFQYTMQKEAGGIAQALSLAEDFIGNQRMVVILGDNIFIPAKEFLERFKDLDKFILNNTTEFAWTCALEVDSLEKASRFGVFKFETDREVEDENRIIEIQEKPKDPPSKWIQTGLYSYPPSVFDRIRNLTPSDRNELEITDLNNTYVKERKFIGAYYEGFWSDAGTWESWMGCNQYLSSLNQQI